MSKRYYFRSPIIFLNNSNKERKKIVKYQRPVEGSYTTCDNIAYC